tara:strand:+ start:5136 stop:5693 length:558 start_codon:yes stop_codon:yes gene_type:complete
MAAIAIIGDGPGGLSAALFIARAGHDVTVYGADETVMHYAFLNNYLGIDAISGTDFQSSARQQVLNAGATISEERVTAVAIVGEGIEVATESDTATADFVVLGEGKQMPLANSLGIQTNEGDDEVVPVDRNGKTAIERVYVVGRSARPTRSQAIISAGDGAAAALDILSQIEGKDVQDWDSPPKD